MLRDVKLLYDVMADTIGYIQVKIRAASLQLARTHTRFTHCARASRASRASSFATRLLTHFARHSAPRFARNYSFKIIPSLKTGRKHAYLYRSIDVQFIFDSARLGLSSSANILQIADVALQVVFLLFLPFFSYFFA